MMQEQEFLFNQMAPPPAAIKEPRRKPAERKNSKKRLILELHQSGVTKVSEIARRANTRPSYVASVLQDAGLLTGYFDLYTTTGRDQNMYSRYFRNVLSFKNVEAARESVAAIERLYRHFERTGDRAGQHHAEVLALTGRNRARFSGKQEEAKIFETWLFNH